MAIKLRVAEIKAMAADIYREICEDRKVHNNDAERRRKQLIEDLVLEDTTAGEIRDVEGVVNYGVSIVEKYLVKKYPFRFRTLPEKKDIVRHLENTLQNKILIESIEATDVVDLIRRVRSEFL